MTCGLNMNTPIFVTNTLPTIDLTYKYTNIESGHVACTGKH